MIQEVDGCRVFHHACDLRHFSLYSPCLLPKNVEVMLKLILPGTGFSFYIGQTFTKEYVLKMKLICRSAKSSKAMPTGFTFKEKKKSLKYA